MCLLLFCRASVNREPGLFLKVIRQTPFVMDGAEQKGMQAGARSWVGKKKQGSGLGDRNVGPTGVPGLLIPAPRQGGPSGLNHRRYGATNSRMVRDS